MTTKEIQSRQRLERQIIRAFCREAIKDGCLIEVRSEGDVLLEKSNNPGKIAKMSQVVDTAHLYVYKDDKLFGVVLLVLGNDGWDVIADNHTNLERYMTGADRIASKY